MNVKLPFLASLLLATAQLRAAEPFFFIQLADPQFGMFTRNKDYAQETANLEFAVATVNRLHPAFVVVSGDVLNKPNDADQVREYKRIMSHVASNIPVYPVVGNHDIGNAPSASDIAAFTKEFGPDHYTFRHGEFEGIVLDSIIIHTPENAAEQMAEQEKWLQAELKKTRDNGAKEVVIFAHHPWFLESADEPDQYFNIPIERRSRYLKWFREAGVKFLFSGHYHRTAGARDSGFEAVTTGPVGMPLAEGRSGLEIVVVRDDGIQHRFYDFSELPNSIDLKAKHPLSPKKTPAP